MNVIVKICTGSKWKEKYLMEKVKQPVTPELRKVSEAKLGGEGWSFQTEKTAKCHSEET